jgi:four helix bundle protein
MAKFTRFEDIEAWKRARELTRKIYECTQTPAFAKDFGLKDQIRRASVSTMSNIAEGFERDGNLEFVQFLSTAKGSVGEVRAQLYVALDVGYISGERFDELSQDAVAIGRMIASLMSYLRTAEHRGLKYKSQASTASKTNHSA